MKKQILSAILVMAIVIGFSSCKKEVEFNSPYKIGQYLNGGIVAYIDGTGQHGLISSSVDLVGYAPCTKLSYYSINTSASYGSGAENTLHILDWNHGNGGLYAAYWVSMSSSKYLWFLPSKDELNLLYKNKEKLLWKQNIWTSVYQSSTVDSTKKVWVQDFNKGKQFQQSITDSAAAFGVQRF